MLNIGIFGNTELLEPHVKRVQKNSNVNIIGKASVGTNTQSTGFHYSIPEFNRVELIERADILLIDNSSPLPFKTLFEMVKKSKHIFTTEYLKLSPDECEELIKLSNESQSIIQVINPFFFTPAIQWINNNFSSPLFLEISKYSANSSIRDILFPLLMMLIKLTGLTPKKVNVSAFLSETKEIDFANIRLKFNNTSVVNINFGNKLPEEQFKIDAFAKNQAVLFNFKTKTFLLNENPIRFQDKCRVNEFDFFIDSIQNKNKNNSNFDDYMAATQLVEYIEKKFAQLID